jgi:hypothetical protein
MWEGEFRADPEAQTCLKAVEQLASKVESRGK